MQLNTILTILALALFVLSCHAQKEDGSGLTLSLRSYNYPAYYIRFSRGAFTGWISQNDGSQDFKQDAVWKVVPGLDNPHAVSLESVSFPGYFLRHQNYLIFLHRYNNDSDLFNKDATFYPRQGLANAQYTSFESINYPGFFLRHQDYRLKIAQFVETQLFREDASFAVTTALSL